MLILPKELPAVTALRHEGIAVYDDHAAVPFAGPVQPLNVALINLMPDKPTTEAQFARLLAAGDRPVRLILTLPDSYEPQNADPEHVRLFYRPWSTVKLHHLDGVIVTGAPLEHLPYQAVRYWSGLTDILDWLTARSVPSMHVCWAAMAALWHDHRVPKTMLAEKCFGVFPHVPLDHRSPPYAACRCHSTCQCHAGRRFGFRTCQPTVRFARLHSRVFPASAWPRTRHDAQSIY